MDAKEFLATFGHIANAPDGVKRLRELILQLAVQGKLVPQDPNDEPASVLLDKIAAEKAKSMLDGSLKKLKRHFSSAIEQDALTPFGWKLVPLVDVILSDIGGGTPSTHRPEYWGGKIPWASVKDIGKTKWLNKTIESITELGLNNSSSNLIQSGSLIVCTRMGLGKISINTIDIAINQDLRALKICSGVEIDYLYNFFLTQNMIGSGMTVKGIRRDQLLAIPFPLPPLAEQKRIVERVDQLMALCDRLEAMQQERAKLRQLTCNTSLDTLANAQTPDDLHQAWQRIQDHSQELLTHSDAVTKLRQTILQLAVMGKLIQQCPNDEPVSELLARIKEDKTGFVNEKTTKNPKTSIPIEPEEEPFHSPTGWIWVRFFTVNTVRSALVSAKDFPSANQIGPDSIEKGTGYILSHRTVAESGAIGPNNKFYKGQILYSKVRPSLNKVMIAPYDGLCSADIYPIMTHINARFMLIVMLSETFLAQVREAENRIKMPKLNIGSLEKFKIPLPPLPEQDRIAARVDQLMLLCDQLEKQLTDERTLANNLAAAAIAALTGTRTEDRKLMKRPKTELVTRLKLVASPANSDQAPLSAILASHATGLSAKDLWNRSGLDIEEFYRQLKNEMARGWIVEPDKAVMREVETA